MLEATMATTLTPAEARSAGRCFRDEADAYRRLLRLAVRQNRYMRRNDVARLEANAREWRRYLPEAQAAKRAREECLCGLARRLDVAPETLSARTLMSVVGEGKNELREALARWQQASGELHRQNAKNGILARFCLDLIRDETEIFCNGVTEDPTGCYEGDGSQRHRTNPGVIERRV